MAITPSPGRWAWKHIAEDSFASFIDCLTLGIEDKSKDKGNLKKEKYQGEEAYIRLYNVCICHPVKNQPKETLGSANSLGVPTAR